MGALISLARRVCTPNPVLGAGSLMVHYYLSTVRYGYMYTVSLGHYKVHHEERGVSRKYFKLDPYSMMI